MLKIMDMSNENISEATGLRLKSIRGYQISKDVQIGSIWKAIVDAYGTSQKEINMKTRQIALIFSGCDFMLKSSK